MIEFKNKIYVGSQARKSVYDATINIDSKAVLIFVHGYKGYKDWGAWNLMEKHLINKGFGFVKFNVSHNGGTVEYPIDFPDLEAFGKNTYSYELADLETIIEETYRLIHQECELSIPIYLLGHSRGGGVAVLAANHPKVDGVISLAGIADIASRFPTGDELDEWKAIGVRYVLNGRTGQEMPHYFDFYLDFKKNEALLDIEKAARKIDKPVLIIHGDMDLSVSISEGLALAEWTNTELEIIKGAEHTFGISHPWEQEDLSNEMKEIVELIDRFSSK